jgi:hypothetical protein
VALEQQLSEMAAAQLRVQPDAAQERRALRGMYRRALIGAQ